ncbi:MAG: SPOR domain-containing protein [Gammaproteobacteria bacterium]|nr:SPOR domain-containing protein [Gammaproteobacteria bacterium]
MSEQAPLKQRLVGAIVLVALAVIFIPMILNGEKDDDFLKNTDSIPVKPDRIKDIRQIEIKQPTRPADTAPLRIPVDEHSSEGPAVTQKATAETKLVKPQTSPKIITRSPEATKAAPKIKTTQAPTVAPTPTPKLTLAWAVQVGSFSSQKNAINFRDKLRKKGFKTFVEKIEARGQSTYRVRVGPFVKRQQAEKSLKELQDKHKIKSLLVKHP